MCVRVYTKVSPCIHAGIHGFTLYTRVYTRVEKAGGCVGGEGRGGTTCIQGEQGEGTRMQDIDTVVCVCVCVCLYTRVHLVHMRVVSRMIERVCIQGFTLYTRVHTHTNTTVSVS